MTKQQAIREYRELVAIQATMPVEKMWTMGEAIRFAKARAMVEIEAAKATR